MRVAFALCVALGGCATAYAPPADPWPQRCPISAEVRQIGMRSGAPREPKTKADRDFNALQVYAIQHLVACGQEQIERGHQ